MVRRSGRAGVILDISDLGARLESGHAQDTPDEFKVLPSASGRPYRHCRGIWRDGLQMGVELNKTISSHTLADREHIAAR